MWQGRQGCSVCPREYVRVTNEAAESFVYAACLMLHQSDAGCGKPAPAKCQGVIKKAHKITCVHCISQGEERICDDSGEFLECNEELAEKYISLFMRVNEDLDVEKADKTRFKCFKFRIIGEEAFHMKGCTYESLPICDKLHKNMDCETCQGKHCNSLFIESYDDDDGRASTHVSSVGLIATCVRSRFCFLAFLHVSDSLAIHMTSVHGYECINNNCGLIKSHFHPFGCLILPFRRWHPYRKMLSGYVRCTCGFGGVEPFVLCKPHFPNASPVGKVKEQIIAYLNPIRVTAGLG
uniref:Uncharacterized protein n=1 Tax=Anopheles funestus TaxID=62324 RepID=A0A4Y0BVU1_ANOFN